MEKFTVTSPDGLKLAACACGNPDGPEILFVHGFNQSYLSWLRQLADPALLRAFRMAAFDLRGHGASDKPEAAENYSDDRRWADDVAAVMDAAGLKRPVLVNWSYGGRVATDYLRHHGAGRLAGINFVAAYTSSDEIFHGPALGPSGEMMSEDLATAIAAARAFTRACFELQPEQDDFETMLAFNMVIPPRVRAAIRARSHNPGDVLPTLRLPVLVTHGDKDRLSLPSRGEYTAARVPGAKLSMYAGIGHAPFWEDAPRFNRELAEFTREAQRAR